MTSRIPLGAPLVAVDAVTLVPTGILADFVPLRAQPGRRIPGRCLGGPMSALRVALLTPVTGPFAAVLAARGPSSTFGSGPTTSENLAVAGRATEVTLDASGGAGADLATLTVRTTSVRLSGGATADISVSDLLTGTASGGAAATVVGGPH